MLVVRFPIACQKNSLLSTCSWVWDSYYGILWYLVVSLLILLHSYQTIPRNWGTSACQNVQPKLNAGTHEKIPLIRFLIGRKSEVQIRYYAWRQLFIFLLIIGPHMTPQSQTIRQENTAPIISMIPSNLIYESMNALGQIFHVRFLIWQFGDLWPKGLVPCGFFSPLPCSHPPLAGQLGHSAELV